MPTFPWLLSTRETRFSFPAPAIPSTASPPSSPEERPISCLSERKRGFCRISLRFPQSVAEKSKLLFINYPNNPTAAIAEKPFFEEVVAFARRYQIIVCHDAAYSEVAFDGYRPASFMEVEGAKEVGIEFHSLSKTFNMTGWRIGFAVGCPKSSPDWAGSRKTSTPVSFRQSRKQGSKPSTVLTLP